MSLWALIQTGGWVMIPLFICSVLVWAIVLERIITLRKWHERNRDFLLSFSNLWLKQESGRARELCEKEDVDLAALAAEFLKEKNPARAVAKLERMRMERSAGFRRFLWILGSIGSSAPFIGLFGTVVGIIRAFQAMAESGTGGFAVVAAGISEALVATASGILVAVVAILFYNYFQTKVGQMQFQLRLLSDELRELLEVP